MEYKYYSAPIFKLRKSKHLLLSLISYARSRFKEFLTLLHKTEIVSVRYY